MLIYKKLPTVSGESAYASKSHRDELGVFQPQDSDENAADLYIPRVDVAPFRDKVRDEAGLIKNEAGLIKNLKDEWVGLESLYKQITKLSTAIQVYFHFSYTGGMPYDRFKGIQVSGINKYIEFSKLDSLSCFKVINDFFYNFRTIISAIDKDCLSSILDQKKEDKFATFITNQDSEIQDFLSSAFKFEYSAFDFYYLRQWLDCILVDYISPIINDLHMIEKDVNPFNLILKSLNCVKDKFCKYTAFETETSKTNYIYFKSFIDSVNSLLNLNEPPLTLPSLKDYTASNLDDYKKILNHLSATVTTKGAEYESNPGDKFSDFRILKIQFFNQVYSHTSSNHDATFFDSNLKKLNFYFLHFSIQRIHKFFETSSLPENGFKKFGDLEAIFIRNPLEQFVDSTAVELDEKVSEEDLDFSKDTDFTEIMNKVKQQYKANKELTSRLIKNNDLFLTLSKQMKFVPTRTFQNQFDFISLMLKLNDQRLLEPSYDNEYNYYTKLSQLLTTLPEETGEAKSKALITKPDAEKLFSSLVPEFLVSYLKDNALDIIDPVIKENLDIDVRKAYLLNLAVDTSYIDVIKKQIIQLISKENLTGTDYLNLNLYLISYLNSQDQQPVDPLIYKGVYKLLVDYTKNPSLKDQKHYEIYKTIISETEHSTKNLLDSNNIKLAKLVLDVVLETEKGLTKLPISKLKKDGLSSLSSTELAKIIYNFSKFYNIEILITGLSNLIDGPEKIEWVAQLFTNNVVHADKVTLDKTKLLSDEDSCSSASYLFACLCVTKNVLKEPLEFKVVHHSYNLVFSNSQSHQPLQNQIVSVKVKKTEALSDTKKLNRLSYFFDELNNSILSHALTEGNSQVSSKTIRTDTFELIPESSSTLQSVLDTVVIKRDEAKEELNKILKETICNVDEDSLSDRLFEVVVRELLDSKTSIFNIQSFFNKIGAEAESFSVFLHEYCVCNLLFEKLAKKSDFQQNIDKNEFRFFIDMLSLDTLKSDLKSLYEDKYKVKIPEETKFGQVAQILYTKVCLQLSGAITNSQYKKILSHYLRGSISGLPVQVVAATAAGKTKLLEVHLDLFLKLQEIVKKIPGLDGTISDIQYVRLYSPLTVPLSINNIQVYPEQSYVCLGSHGKEEIIYVLDITQTQDGNCIKYLDSAQNELEVTDKELGKKILRYEGRLIRSYIDDPVPDDKSAINYIDEVACKMGIECQKKVPGASSMTATPDTLLLEYSIFYSKLNFEKFLGFKQEYTSYVGPIPKLQELHSKIEEETQNLQTASADHLKKIQMLNHANVKLVNKDIKLKDILISTENYKQRFLLVPGSYNEIYDQSCRILKDISKSYQDNDQYFLIPYYFGTPHLYLLSKDNFERVEYTPTRVEDKVWTCVYSANRVGGDYHSWSELITDYDKVLFQLIATDTENECENIQYVGRMRGLDVVNPPKCEIYSKKYTTKIDYLSNCKEIQVKDSQALVSNLITEHLKQARTQIVDFFFDAYYKGMINKPKFSADSKDALTRLKAETATANIPSMEIDINDHLKSLVTKNITAYATDVTRNFENGNILDLLKAVAYNEDYHSKIKVDLEEKYKNLAAKIRDCVKKIGGRAGTQGTYMDYIEKNSNTKKLETSIEKLITDIKELNYISCYLLSGLFKAGNIEHILNGFVEEIAVISSKSPCKSEKTTISNDVKKAIKASLFEIKFLKKFDRYYQAKSDNQEDVDVHDIEGNATKEKRINLESIFGHDIYEQLNKASSIFRQLLADKSKRIKVIKDCDGFLKRNVEPLGCFKIFKDDSTDNDEFFPPEYFLYIISKKSIQTDNAFCSEKSKDVPKNILFNAAFELKNHALNSFVECFLGQFYQTELDNYKKSLGDDKVFEGNAAIKFVKDNSSPTNLDSLTYLEGTVLNKNAAEFWTYMKTYISQDIAKEFFHDKLMALATDLLILKDNFKLSFMEYLRYTCISNGASIRKTVGQHFPAGLTKVFETTVPPQATEQDYKEINDKFFELINAFIMDSANVEEKYTGSTSKKTFEDGVLETLVQKKSEISLAKQKFQKIIEKAKTITKLKLTTSPEKITYLRNVQGHSDFISGFASEAPFVNTERGTNLFPSKSLQMESNESKEEKKKDITPSKPSTPNSSFSSPNKVNRPLVSHSAEK